MREVKTRIAPSPTGKLHIGTARTALFSYLYAKKNKGKFLLRFEDTDQARSTKESEEQIIRGFKWLGIKWDDDIVYQMDRLDIYNSKANELLKRGIAYKKDGAIFINAKKALEVTGFEYKEVMARREGKEIVSFLIKTDYKDMLAGNISGNVEDFVIMRSTGVPTFHFAVVIDDNDMGITHVIRGADHFSNTPKHIVLYKLLGLDVPVYCHIPLTLNPEKGTGKLSKRSGSVSIDDFKKDGYLPDALINFMVLLGWHPSGSDKEFFSISELEKEFSLESISKSNAIFDINKLDNINGVYLRNSRDKDLLQKMSDIFEIPNADQKYLTKVLSLVKDRMKKLTDFKELSSYFFNEPKYQKDMLVFKKSDMETTLHGLMIAESKFKKLGDDDWPQTKEEFKKILEKAMLSERLGFGDVFWPVRVALSGRETSPSPDELLLVMPKDLILKRLEKAINLLK